MFTYNSMIISTPMNIILNYRLVKTALQTTNQGSVDDRKYNEFIYKARATSVIRNLRIVIFDNGHTWIHCSCPWFTYNCEYVLAKEGSSSIINSTGSVPQVNNINNRPWVCKHSIACIFDLRNRKFIV